ncbi:MAG: allophanate hydrolase, partial [Burkholderiales bacterium]
MPTPYSLDRARLAAAYSSGALTPSVLVRDVFRAIAQTRADSNPIWIHLPPEDAVAAQARQLEARRAAGEELPLYGIPFAVKDNIDVASLPTTAACPAYAYIPRHTAHAVRMLEQAGALLIGKTNLDQFATGLVGTRSPYGACFNPFDRRYIAGGSSSGSALAVATGLASFAFGTDTAGSGRIPAAFTNIVGLKPTRGLISTSGIVPACRSLDCVSVFALSCADALAVLATAGDYDPADPYSRRPEEPEGFSAERFRFVLPHRGQLEFFGDRAYATLFEAAVARLQALGGTPAEADFTPFLAAQQLLYDGPWIAERAAELGGFIASHPEAVHPVTRAVIESGRGYSAIDAFKAQYRLAGLKRATEAVWQAGDVLVVPGAPTIYTIAQVEADPITLNSRLGLYTNFVNLLDLAAITVPAGFRPDGLPFGVTLIGPAFSDRPLAALGARLHAASCETAGACGARVPQAAPAQAVSSTVQLAVVGAHLSGMPLNHQLTERGARLLRTTRTAPLYRLYALTDNTPPKPGLVHVERAGHGTSIEVELWEMPLRLFGPFVAAIPSPLGIGTIELESGEPVKGFLCEPYAVEGLPDIT